MHTIIFVSTYKIHKIHNMKHETFTIFSVAAFLLLCYALMQKEAFDTSAINITRGLGSLLLAVIIMYVVFGFIRRSSADDCQQSIASIIYSSSR